MNIISNIKSIVATALCIMLVGCIREDLSNCPVNREISHYLTFEYTKNIDFADKFADAVTSLDVFVFDSNQKLAEIISDEGASLKTENYQIVLHLPDGTYTFVAWGGSRNAYRIFDAVDNAPLTEETTRFDRLRLVLNNGHTFENTDNLFHGIAYDIHIRSGQPSHTHIGLTKNTNIIRVTVTGVFHPENIAVGCYAANGEYRFDNSVSNHKSLISYKPVRTENKIEVKAGFKTLRLLTGMKSELVVHDTDKNEDIFHRDLIELLRLSPDICTDDDLDRYDVYDIKIDLHADMSASVIINGYLVISSDKELAK